MALADATREKLKKVSTATLCTALFKRGLSRQFIQDVRPLGIRTNKHGGRGLYTPLHACT